MHLGFNGTLEHTSLWKAGHVVRCQKLIAAITTETSSIRAAGVQEFYCHGLSALISWSEVEINVKIHSVKANDWRFSLWAENVSQTPASLYNWEQWVEINVQIQTPGVNWQGLQHCTVIITVPIHIRLREHNGPYKRPDWFDPENCSFPI